MLTMIFDDFFLFGRARHASIMMVVVSFSALDN